VHEVLEKLVSPPTPMTSCEPSTRGSLRLWRGLHHDCVPVAVLKNNAIQNELTEGGREGTRIYAALKAIQPV
jgi:hypothetical protein